MSADAVRCCQWVIDSGCGQLSQCEYRPLSKLLFGSAYTDNRSVGAYPTMMYSDFEGDYFPL